MGNLKHSITLFGFGNKYVRGEYTFEDILDRVKKLGGDGIEVVAPQMVPGHPNPSKDWISYFRDACQKYELTPVCYSIYVDSGKHKSRFLTEDERFTETINEMETAKKLGFQIVRSQDALLPRTMEKLLPYAQELGLHLAIELHGPWSPSTPVFQEYYDLFERQNSKVLGVIMDFSAFASGAPEIVLNCLPDDSCHKDLIMDINNLYITTEIPEAELEQRLLSSGGDMLDVEICRQKIFSIPKTAKMGTIYYRTHPDFEGFRRLLKHSVYIHGKYYHCNQNLQCVGLDYPQFIRIMKEEGYNGFICSEYEGAPFDASIDEEEQIARHIRMLDKLWIE